jgi:hypothetical protein
MLEQKIIRFVAAINIPATNIAFKTPDLITNNPPNNVNITVVIHPKFLNKLLYHF